MATIKLSIKCSRCPREEDTKITLEQAVALASDKTVKPAAMTIHMDGEPLASYENLCSSCRGIVLGYLDGAVRKPEKRSAIRAKQKPVAARPSKPAKA